MSNETFTSAYDLCNIRPKSESAFAKLSIGDVIEAYFEDMEQPCHYVVTMVQRHGRSEADVHLTEIEDWGGYYTSSACVTSMASDLNTDKWQVVGKATLNIQWTKDTGFKRPETK